MKWIDRLLLLIAFSVFAVLLLVDLIWQAWTK
jgi:hypothetical protein